MKINPINLSLLMLVSQVVIYADEDSQLAQVPHPPRNIEDKSDKNTQRQVKLSTSVVTAPTDLETYQSGETINQEMLETNPSGNGDITSILRILPNVQYDNAQLKSTTPGEIDPANISISGGLFYQNNFQLDGFNMNNDLDPAGGTTNGPAALKSGRSQGFNIDTSLLESVSVQDSNISAAYGRFTGGVVEANIRKPRNDGFHGNISYQYTSDKFTRYFIHENAESAFATSSDENYQPHFTKHLIKASVEGYITKNLGLIGAFSTTRSYIPLNAYSTIATANTTITSAEANTQREQKRISDNYYLKAHYNPTESFTLEANIGYIPQFNTYYNNVAKNSYYTMQSGGWQAGLKALWDTSLGLWTNNLGYSRLQNSRRSDASYFFSWYASSEKNWAINSAGRAGEGGYGDNDQLQNTLTYKSDMAFEPLDIWKTSHTFRIGGELSYQSLANNRLTDYYGFSNPVNTNNMNCPVGADNLGLYACSNASPITTAQSSWSGQYFNAVNLYLPKGTLELNTFSYGIFAEDDIKLYLQQYGEINTRFGLRLDGDNYMDKHTLAPRFSMNYTTPANRAYKSTFIFGANRYYGRNLFSYRLYDALSTTAGTYNRTSSTDDWVFAPNNNRTSSTKFSQLNVPYDDELMIGITQNLWAFNATLKYIHREGKDEIMRRSRSTSSGNAPAIAGYSNTYNFYTNDGSSQSDIITFTLNNITPLETFGVKHHYLLAFDYTNTKRTYNLFSADEAYFDDNDIVYNGEIIKYRNRPTDNYTRPYTLRLNTTHSFNIWKTKWLWNNFFRYRAGYERMVLLTRTSAGYNPNYSNLQQYGKMRFQGAFTWDMRIGFDVNVYKGNTLFMNLDIYNVLNTQNMTTTSGSNTLVYATSTAIPVYEVGRQFWLEVGYRY